jgi:hypothetical protein
MHRTVTKVCLVSSQTEQTKGTIKIEGAALSQKFLKRVLIRAVACAHDTSSVHRFWFNNRAINSSCKDQSHQPTSILKTSVYQSPVCPFQGKAVTNFINNCMGHYLDALQGKTFLFKHGLQLLHSQRLKVLFHKSTRSTLCINRQINQGKYIHSRYSIKSIICTLCPQFRSEIHTRLSYLVHCRCQCLPSSQLVSLQLPALLACITQNQVNKDNRQYNRHITVK